MVGSGAVVDLRPGGRLRERLKRGPRAELSVRAVVTHVPGQVGFPCGRSDAPWIGRALRAARSPGSVRRRVVRCVRSTGSSTRADPRRRKAVPRRRAVTPSRPRLRRPRTDTSRIGLDLPPRPLGSIFAGGPGFRLASWTGETSPPGRIVEPPRATEARCSGGVAPRRGRAVAGSRGGESAGAPRKSSSARGIHAAVARLVARWIARPTCPR